MIEECLEPYLVRLRRYQEREASRHARDYCLAVLEGIDAFDRESASPLRDHAPDAAAEVFAWVADEYARGTKDAPARAEMERLVAARFPGRAGRNWT